MEVDWQWLSLILSIFNHSIHIHHFIPLIIFNPLIINLFILSFIPVILISFYHFTLQSIKHQSYHISINSNSFNKQSVPLIMFLQFHLYESTQYQSIHFLRDPFLMNWSRASASGYQQFITHTFTTQFVYISVFITCLYSFISKWWNI